MSADDGLEPEDVDADTSGSDVVGGRDDAVDAGEPSAQAEEPDAPATAAGALSAEAWDAEESGEEPVVASDEATQTDGAPEDLGARFDGDLPPLPTVLEAILLVTDVPVPAITLAQVVERPTGEVEEVLAELARGYDEQERGFELRQVAGGWRFYTRAECAPFVERFVLDGQQARLTQAALETLAVIAYRQPVTRQRVSAVRGVNVDGVVRTLVARGLITEAGTDEDTGATRYRTTSYFMERLGLQSLEELPSLAPLLPELEDLADDSVSG